MLNNVTVGNFESMTIVVSQATIDYISHSIVTLISIIATYDQKKNNNLFIGIRIILLLYIFVMNMYRLFLNKTKSKT